MVYIEATALFEVRWRSLEPKRNAQAPSECDTHVLGLHEVSDDIEPKVIVPLRRWSHAT